MPVAAAKPTRRTTVAKQPAARFTGHRVILDRLTVEIPAWVNDHESFRRWVGSDDFPEKVRVSFLNGEVIFDMSKEQLYSHNRMKTVITTALNHLATQHELGEFFCDGVMISHLGAKVSNNPDGVFVSNASFEEGSVRRVKDAGPGYIELEGSPDLVVEVVSASSVKKDTVLLREAYWKAKVREYWLIDARGEQLQFQILKHTSKGYSVVATVSGWTKSAVLGKSFRLIAKTNHLGHPDFELMVK